MWHTWGLVEGEGKVGRAAAASASAARLASKSLWTGRYILPALLEAVSSVGGVGRTCGKWGWGVDMWGGVDMWRVGMGVDMWGGVDMWRVGMGGGHVWGVDMYACGMSVVNGGSVEEDECVCGGLHIPYMPPTSGQCACTTQHCREVL